MSPRYARLFHSSGTTVILPMDHGGSGGVVPGLSSLHALITAAAESGVNAVLGNTGMFRFATSKNAHMGWIVQSSVASIASEDENEKITTVSAAGAVSLGADAISLHINIGCSTTTHQLKSLGTAVEEGRALGLPVVAMMYPRGPFCQNPTGIKEVASACRVGAELGADIIKVPYTGSTATFKKVIKESLGVPVVIAGGQPGTTENTLTTIQGAMSAGARGVMMGRAVFQSKKPAGLLRATCALVHEGKSVAAAKKWAA